MPDGADRADGDADGASVASKLDPTAWSRRRVLAALGAGGTAAGGAVGGGRLLTDPDDGDTTTLEDDDRERALVERFAPELYFDEHEQWYPTDPRPYETAGEAGPVVDGFTALNEYTRAFAESGEPPGPVAFYNVVRYEDSPLAVVQYWFYAAFDQFTTNFHWHDWEVLAVFVDLETDEPQLYVASAHDRNVPNNEFLDPERSPSIIPELGAHASGLAVNENPDQFQRLPDGELRADITNDALEGLDRLAELPIAYGLPRDEGIALPFVMPTLDGEPLYEHEALPDVGRADFIAPELTVRSYSELLSPPESLPARATGLQFTPEADPDSDADIEYALEPSAELEHIEAFDGPPLSFEFEVPAFAEDAISGHLTTADTPWTQPRYDNPAADITEPAHRQALANRYDAVDYGGPTAKLAGALEQAIAESDAPDGNGVTTTAAGTIAFCLLESDPVTVPTWGRAVAIRDVEPGEHRLTVNAPGTAPYSERVTAEDGETTPLGAEGGVTLVANEDAVKVDGDATDGPDIGQVAVEDDFGGRLLEFRPTSADQFAAYVHRGGAYTVELRDADDEPGAYRVNPGAEDRRTIDSPQTGTEPLASFLADITTETAEQAPEFAGGDAAEETTDDGDTDDTRRGGGSDSDDTGGSEQGDGGGGPVDVGGVPEDPLADPGDIDVAGLQGLQRALRAAADSAERAAERAAASDAPGADRALEAAVRRLERVRASLDVNAFDDTLERTVDNRLEQATRRARQAIEAGGSN